MPLGFQTERPAPGFEAQSQIERQARRPFAGQTEPEPELELPPNRLHHVSLDSSLSSLSTTAAEESLPVSSTTERQQDTTR